MENGSVPIIGGNEVRVTTGFNALVRKLDERGTFKPKEVRQASNGQPIAIPDRGDYLDATELLNAIRLIVREELARLPNRAQRRIRGDISS